MYFILIWLTINCELWIVMVTVGVVECGAQSVTWNPFWILCPSIGNTGATEVQQHFCQATGYIDWTHARGSSVYSCKYWDRLCRLVMAVSSQILVFQCFVITTHWCDLNGIVQTKLLNNIRTNESMTKMTVMEAIYHLQISSSNFSFLNCTCSKLGNI